MYRTNGNVNVFGSGISIVGPLDRSAIIQPQAGTAQGSAIAIFGDNFEVKNITVDAGLVKINVISSISNNIGLIENCQIHTFSAQTYGIWVYDSSNVQVLNNDVDGGTIAHPDQEGIELSASSNVTVKGNSVSTIGGNEIFDYNWGSSSNILIHNNGHYPLATSKALAIV